MHKYNTIYNIQYYYYYTINYAINKHILHNNYYLSNFIAKSDNNNRNKLNNVIYKYLTLLHTYYQ